MALWSQFYGDREAISALNGILDVMIHESGIQKTDVQLMFGTEIRLFELSGDCFYVAYKAHY